ncbi:MAG: phosphoribosyltransferase family protein [Methanomicrobiales archaeon]|jgi:predicted phosphoribosyltransferase
MGGIHEDIALRDRAPVFRDRDDAGRQLGRYLATFPGLDDPLACPIPAGGIPVGIAVARALGCPVRPVIVRKIQIPWNTEAGFGAVAWDGHVFLNKDLLSQLHLTPDQVEAATAKARANVREREQRLNQRLGGPLPDPAGRSCILVDDGLASGYTMAAACQALRPLGPLRIVVAVPTGSLSSVRQVGELAEEVICLNIRTGPSFAVADAYREWYDLTEEEGVRMLLDGWNRGRSGRE